MQKAALADAKELEGISSFFDLEAKDIKGKTVKFEQFRGKVTIVVNVASYCGYTESHYRGLVELWSKIKDENIEILAFPCNQFGAQEPESDSKILQFVKSKVRAVHGLISTAFLLEVVSRIFLLYDDRVWNSQ